MNNVVGAASAAKQASTPPQQPIDHWEGVPVPIIAAAITVCGGLFIAYIVNRWNRKREREGRFAAAAIKFRDAFSSDLAAVESGALGRLALMDYLRAAYDDRHAAAVLAFEPSISREMAPGFRDAWNRYRYGENEDGSAAAVSNEGLDHDEFYFLCYLSPGHSWETHIPKPAKQKALERMHALLSYASEA